MHATSADRYWREIANVVNKKKRDKLIAGLTIEIFVLCKRERNPSTCNRRFSQDHQRVPRARVAPPAYPRAHVDRCRWITKLRKARVLLPEYRPRFRFRRWLSVLISRNLISVSSRKKIWITLSIRRLKRDETNWPLIRMISPIRK